MLLARRDFLLAFGATLFVTSARAEDAPRFVAGVGWRGSKVQLFFSDGTYTRLDMATRKVDDGYPKPVDDETWPGLAPYARDIVAACNWPGDKLQFFLKDGRYIRYDMAKDRADPGYPQPVDDSSWPGLAAYKHLFGCMVNLDNKKAVIFLTDERIIVYDIAADRIDPGYPKSM